MLYNANGNLVKINPKFNSRENPNIFVPLREVKDTLPAVGHMFNLCIRAKFKQ